MRADECLFLVEKRSCGGHRRMTEFETELRHCSLLSRIAYRNVAPLLREK
jgi:hypothetical protein